MLKLPYVFLSDVIALSCRMRLVLKAWRTMVPSVIPDKAIENRRMEVGPL